MVTTIAGAVLYPVVHEGEIYGRGERLLFFREQTDLPSFAANGFGHHDEAHRARFNREWAALLSPASHDSNRCMRQEASEGLAPRKD